MDCILRTTRRHVTHKKRPNSARMAFQGHTSLDKIVKKIEAAETSLASRHHRPSSQSCGHVIPVHTDVIRGTMHPTQHVKQQTKVSGGTRHPAHRAHAPQHQATEPPGTVNGGTRHPAHRAQAHHWFDAPQHQATESPCTQHTTSSFVWCSIPKQPQRHIMITLVGALFQTNIHCRSQRHPS
jgi:hypothetical protein